MDDRGSLTPGQVAAAFLEAWRIRDWPAMHGYLQVRRRERRTAAGLAELFGTKRLEGHRMLAGRTISRAAELTTSEGSAGAIAPEANTVGAFVTYRIGAKRFRRIVLLNVILEGPDGNPPHTRAAGEWGVNEISALRELPVPR